MVTPWSAPARPRAMTRGAAARTAAMTSAPRAKRSHRRRRMFRLPCRRDGRRGDSLPPLRAAYAPGVSRLGPAPGQEIARGRHGKNQERQEAEMVDDELGQLL